MQLLRRHRLARLADHGVSGGKNRLVGGTQRPRRGQHAGEIARHHGQRALRQIAEIVGEIGVDAVDDRLMAVVAVLPERHLAQEEIAQRIDAVGLGERKRIDDVADRLRHLLAAVEQKAVGEDAARHGNACRHQEGRPVHGVEAHDVLADHVQVGRPIAAEFLAVGIGKIDGGDVVGERVNPHIHHVPGIARHLDAPVEGRA